MCSYMTAFTHTKICYLSITCHGHLLKKNGFLISDDVSENNAFLDFYSIVNGSPILMTDNQDKEIFLGVIRKK